MAVPARAVRTDNTWEKCILKARSCLDRLLRYGGIADLMVMILGMGRPSMS